MRKFIVIALKSCAGLIGGDSDFCYKAQDMLFVRMDVMKASLKAFVENFLEKLPTKPSGPSSNM